MRGKRSHVFDQRICEAHQTLLDDPCWCGVVHGPRIILHDDDCPAAIGGAL